MAAKRKVKSTFANPDEDCMYCKLPGGIVFPTGKRAHSECVAGLDVTPSVTITTPAHERGMKAIAAHLEKIAEEEAQAMPAKFVVHEHLISEANGLVTIDREHAAWGPVDGDDVPLPKAKFARIQPPESATDQKIEQIRGELAAAGVETIVVQPRPRAQVVTNQQVARSAHAGIREIVEAMVREANTPNREALEALVQSELSKVGL